MVAARRFSIAILLVLCACSDDKKTQPPPPTPDAAPNPMGTTNSVKFGGTLAEAEGAGQTSFNVNTISSLWLVYTVKDIPDVAILRLDTFTPSGLAFTSYVAAYSRDPMSHPTAMAPGVADPITVQGIQTDANGNVLLPYAIAISGTDFVRHAMNGTWKFRVSVDSVANSQIDAQITLMGGP
jgi:hypothetical protein